MTPTNKGSFKIFAFTGIGVYVHWSWFLVAVYSVQFRTHHYSSMTWNAVEYLSLFLIVLIHEFGHQLACRQVGGRTHDIVLWPLGGVAYVSPPERPGAQLWTIAAGPLVNVLLLPVLLLLAMLSARLDWPDSQPNLHELIRNILFINFALLIFNLMPVYPLDGGQILRSLLWYVVGRAKSLMAVSVIGFFGVAVLSGVAVWSESTWLGIMAVFLLLNCWRGLNHARALTRATGLPRRSGFACPSCKCAPPLAELWQCGNCGKAFDMFLANAVCPHCGKQYGSTQCLDCGISRPIGEWATFRTAVPEPERN